MELLYVIISQMKHDMTQTPQTKYLEDENKPIIIIVPTFR